MTTINIWKQKLITSTSSFIKNNIKLVKISQYLFQFSFDVKHKIDKKNIVSDVFFRLNSIDVILFEIKNYLELNTLYVYNVTLIEINEQQTSMYIDKLR